MTVVVIQASRSGKVAAMASAIASHYRLTNIITDLNEDLVPFPASGTLIFSERTPAEIFRWRDKHRPTGTGEVVRFLTVETALDEIARDLTQGMRLLITAPNPDLIVIPARNTAEAFTRRGLGLHLYRQAYQLTPLGYDLRTRFQAERRAA